MLLDIKNLLRADEPNREPMPKRPVFRAARKAKPPPTTRDAERLPHKSNMRAMASELDNFSLADFPLGTFDAKVEHQLKIQTWKTAVRAVPEDPEFTFPAAPRRDRPANAHMYGLVVVEDSDLSTLFGSDCTDASTETIKVVDLFSLAEINSKKNAFVPPLIIRYNDVIGDRRLTPKKDGFMYYDISADPLHHVISCRSVDVLPGTPSHAFFKNHAVRVFYECPPVPGIKNGPFYKYIGDYYLKRTEKYLPKEQWDAANEEIKDIFVKRFIAANSKTDNYRTPNDFTMKSVRNLFACGYIFPLVVLQQAYRDPEPFYESASPYGSTESFEFPSSAGVSLDTASVYSQESAPGDGEECPFETYAAASGLQTPPSPAPVPARRPLVTYEDGAQVIHLDCDFVPCYTEAGAVCDESPVLERTVVQDQDKAGEKAARSWDDDGHTAAHGGDAFLGDGHAELFYDDQGNILRSVFENDDDDDTEEHDDGVANDNDSMNTEDAADEVNNTDSEATESGTTPLQLAAEFILRLMRSEYHEIQSFCAYLHQTSDSSTEHGRARLELLRILQAYSAPFAPWKEAHQDQSSDEEDDARSDVTERAPASLRLPMVPWFDGFEPLPIIITEDRV